MRIFANRDGEGGGEGANAQVQDGITAGGEKSVGMDAGRVDAEAGAQTQVQMEIDPEMEKRVRRKLDWHIIPLVSALYLLAFLDRSNIG
jgi:hypothetical protein